MVRSPLLKHPIEVATPPPFSGGVEGVWSPEHLFVASVSSCFMTTFLAVAENSKLEFSRFSCRATGEIDKGKNRYLINRIILAPRVAIPDYNHREKAGRVLEKAKAACLISNSIKTEIVFRPDIAVAAYETV